MQNKPRVVEKPWGGEEIWAITDCQLIEVSTSELDDVVRLEDDYDRN